MEFKLTDIYPHLPGSPMSYKVGKVFNTADMVGVEIELEGLGYLNHKETNLSYWEITKDDSLRNNGVEFRFLQPLFGEDLEAALKELELFLDKYQKTYGPLAISERCSIHVHLDVRGLSIKNILNINTLGITFEKPLFHLAGSTRYGNIYCFPLQEDLCNIQRLSEISSDDPRSIKEGLKSAKYASINTASIEQRGSIEFRHHEGTLDFERLTKWIRVLLNMKNAAVNFEVDIDEYPEYVSRKGILQFVKDIMGEEADEISYDGFHLDILEGVRYAQRIIHNTAIELSHKKLSRKRNIKDKDENLMDQYINKHGLQVEGET